MKKFAYLATPYSKYPGGIEKAFREAARLTGLLLQRGICAYSPIAHTHPIAIYGKLDPYDHTIWLPFDEAMMDAAEHLIVAMMPSWETSTGIKHEIEYFTKAGKPVYYYDLIEDKIKDTHEQQD